MVISSLLFNIQPPPLPSFFSTIEYSSPSAMPSKRSSINSKVRSQSNIHSARISRSRVAAQSLHDLRDGDEDIWFSESELYKHHIMEIRNKWQTLDDSIWAKIICLEGNRRVAKAYARAPAICIDGSDLAFDGETIGLGGFDNPHRDSATRSAIRTIRKGILLTIDEKGNIWVERRSHCNVYTPDWTKDPNKTCLDRELIASRGVLPRKCKVFDMSKFLENLIHELDNAYPDIQPLESQSIVNLTFNYKGNFLLESPISLLVINMVALQILRKRFPPIEGPQQEQKLLGKFKLRAKKICEKLGIGSKHSRNLSRSWALDSSQPWKNSDKNGSTYQSYVDNYLPVPFRESRENRENLGMISRSEPPTSAKYSSIDGYSTFNRNFNNNIERSSKNFFNSTYNRGFTMDSRAKIYVPDPDYDSSSSELPSLSDLPPIVKNSHGNRKSLDVIPKSNNRGNDSDWDGIPVKNEYVGRSKSKSQSLGPLNSCLRIMPINASLAPKEEQEEITLNSVCEEKMHNNQTLATSNSSASIQSSPDADTHIYSSIHDSKESKSSLESNSSNESPPAFE